MTDLDELLTRYLDDALTEAQAGELQSRLRSNPTELSAFLESIAREEQLRTTVVSTETLAQSTMSVHAPMHPNTMRRSIQMLAGGVICACLLGFLVYSMNPESGEGLALTLAGASGPVTVIGGDSQRWTMKVGQQIPVERSVVTRDGTRATFKSDKLGTISLVGNSRISVSDSSRNSISVNHGVIIASITSQADRRPLKIQTSSAEATVLGTSLAINAFGQQTIMQVNRGSVRFRRLSDDQALDVKQEEVVRTSVGNAQELKVAPISKPPAEWKADQNFAEAERWLGKWNDEHLLKAIPRTVFVKEQEAEEIHFHAGVTNVYPGFVELTHESMVLVRYRISRPINLGVFISTHASSWDFTGNFQAYVEHLKAPPDTDGWRTVALPIRLFTPLSHSGLPFRSGCEISTIYVTSYGQDVGLEIAELRISTSTD